MRFMPIRDVVYLIVKPFLGKQRGPTRAETVSRAVEHAEHMDSAAAFTRVSDAMLDHAPPAPKHEEPDRVRASG
jgi:anaerobic magnesium-protoporphyrin IX monomethyl ester cyclase